MHHLHLIHTDLKPENIRFSSSEYKKIPYYRNGRFYVASFSVPFMESIGTVVWHSCCSRDCLVHHFTSLLVRNIPRDCRSDELRMPFEHFGPLKDVYLLKDYYTGEPRGFDFVQFIDPQDDAEAQYHMDG